MLSLPLREPSATRCSGESATTATCGAICMLLRSCSIVTNRVNVNKFWKTGFHSPHRTLFNRYWFKRLIAIAQYAQPKHPKKIFPIDHERKN